VDRQAARAAPGTGRLLPLGHPEQHLAAVIEPMGIVGRRAAQPRGPGLPRRPYPRGPRRRRRAPLPDGSGKIELYSQELKEPGRRPRCERHGATPPPAETPARLPAALIYGRAPVHSFARTPEQRGPARPHMPENEVWVQTKSAGRPGPARTAAPSVLEPEGRVRSRPVASRSPRASGATAPTSCTASATVATSLRRASGRVLGQPP